MVRTKAFHQALALIAGLCATGRLATMASAANLPPLSPANSIECMNWASTPTPLSTTPPLARPQDIAVDGAGDVFVVDTARAEVIRLDATSSDSVVLLGPPWLEIPVGLTISPSHADLYIGDENSSTIWHLPCKTRNSNKCSEYYTKPLNITLPAVVHPLGLQMDGDDHLYIADFNNHRVWKRNVQTGDMTTILSAANMGSLAPANPFGPHDIAIDPTTHEVLVTDVTNDDIWSLQCKTPDKSGNSCDQYNPQPFKLELTGSSANIAAPSGIVVNLQRTVFVSGMKNGIVAEIKGNKSVDLLQEGTPGYLKDPVSLAYDARPTSKTLYIADDPTDNTDHSQGLYALPCSELACVALDERFINNVRDGECANVPIGQTCSFTCAQGHYTPNNTLLTCTENGWNSQGMVCLKSSPTLRTTPGPDADASAGAAFGALIAMLAILALALFAFVRVRQRSVLSVAQSAYTPFGTTNP